MKIHPHLIDRSEDTIKLSAGKRYNSKIDIKSAFNTIRIRKTDVYKNGLVTPVGYFEFLRMPSGIRNGPSTMTRVIKLAYNHLVPHNVNTYIDDVSISREDFSDHLKVLSKIFEATYDAGFKLTPGKSQLSMSEMSLYCRIGFASHFRKRNLNYAA
ncbi:retrovirus-related Pol polyprotein from transposon opus [Nephila pilipes]|uniref:Retrovirus-related Pol polyprotein from transposon opus n=1 Tax=Nephila pilipes TaxID=299642 RepID=A0A8X6MZ51_NEPPI|nr:retrovirus-related Pol polyprotein from transposon opus [Nephila pilipes]